jgi:hypothetical protein
MQRLLLIIGILLLFATEILRVYFIMPFPGSQHSNTIDLAYFIDRHRIGLRLFGLLLVLWPLFIWSPPTRASRSTPTFRSSFPTRKRSLGPKIALAVIAVFYVVIFYFFNFRFEADKMFYQPRNKTFATAATNAIDPRRLVIGVVIDHQARAYPIQLIGYHHQVKDTIGNTPVMITYCTVCRTGRVYSPMVNGKLENFRLVGMDHFNAMFEDATTNSWWRQATGIAIAGPLKNARLSEIPSTQSTLAEWLQQYPDSKILQPDTTYAKHYAALVDYDNGMIDGSLEKRDSGSWKAKSWVVGVISGHQAKAYDWNWLAAHPLIQDTIGNHPILLYQADTANFIVLSRVVDGQTLFFSSITQPLSLSSVAGKPLSSAGKQPSNAGKQLVASKPSGSSASVSISGTVLIDSSTHSVWTPEGRCISGLLKDRQLQPVQSYQEFWHSWSYFHPQTTCYGIH